MIVIDGINFCRWDIIWVNLLGNINIDGNCVWNEKEEKKIIELNVLKIF